MTADVDTEIRRAMIELADAAPLPPSLSTIREVRAVDRFPARGPQARPVTVVVLAFVVTLVAVGVASLVGRSATNTVTSPVTIDSTISSPSSDVAATSVTSPGQTATTPSVKTTTSSATTIDSSPSSVVESGGALDRLGLVGPLPDDLQIWDVLATRVTLTAATTTQLFGAFDSAGTRVERGILLAITAATGPLDGGGGLPHTVVRGLDAVVTSAPSATDVSWMWLENGLTVTADVRGMSDVDAFGVLAGLRWRSDAQAGFDPSSSTVPLLVEAIQHVGDSQPLTRYMLAPSSATFADDEEAHRPIDLMIGQTFSAAPVVVFGGVKQESGYTVCETCLGNVYAIALAPRGDLISLGLLDLELGERLLSSLAPMSAGQLAAQAAEATDRQGSLPVITSATVGPATIEQRGADPIAPTSQCVAIGTQRACRLFNFSHDSEVRPRALQSVSIDGNWYLVEVGGATDPASSFVLPDGVTPLQPETLVDSDRRWSLFAVPDGVDSVAFHYPGSNAFPANGTYYRPSDAASTNAPTIAAPADGSATPGATTTTTTNPDGTPFSFAPLVLAEPPAGYTLQYAHYSKSGGRLYYGGVLYTSTDPSQPALFMILRPTTIPDFPEWADRPRWTVDGKIAMDDSQVGGCTPDDGCSVGVQWDDSTYLSLTWLPAGASAAADSTIDGLLALIPQLVENPTAFGPGDLTVNGP